MSQRHLQYWACPDAPRAAYRRRLCPTCSSIDEAAARLYTWVTTQGGERLVTEGGEAEEASSPLRPSHDDAQHVEQEQQKQPEGVQGTTTRTMQPMTVDETDFTKSQSDIEGINLDYLDLNKLRPLSGSTIASSSTQQTAIGSSTIPSKRQSIGQTRDNIPPSQADLELSHRYDPIKMRRISNPNGDYHPLPPGTTFVLPSIDNAPSQQPTTSTPQAKKPQQTTTTKRPPSFQHPILHPTDGPDEAHDPSSSPPDPMNRDVTTTTTTDDNDEDDADAPLNIGALKRTISTLTFDDLTPQTRTAFPASEAPDELPPAYARPRSEVGLPPLMPGCADTDTDELDDDDDEEEEDADGDGDGENRIQGVRQKSVSRGRSRARSLASQVYFGSVRGKIGGRR
jgi:hypothetical protein